MRSPGRARTWLYRQLLRSHPTAFRRRYEHELISTFTDAWTEQIAATGPLAELAFWHRLVSRELAAGLTARWHLRRESGPAARTPLRTDLRLAWRSVLRAQGLSAVVVLTLGLGIGASTLVYTVVDFTLLRPLPYADAGRLVRVYLADREDPGELAAVTGAHYLSYRGAAAFEVLAPVYTMEPTYADVSSGDVPRRIRTLRVGAAYFDVLTQQPIVGRVFRAEEERANAGLVVLSEHAWHTLHGSSVDVVGTRIALDGAPHEVVGVVPSAADPVAGTVDAYVPLDLTPGGVNHADNNYLTLIGRLARETTVASARGALAAAGRAVEAEAPEAIRWTPRIIPLQEDVVGDTRGLFLVLLGAVAVMLAIICVNVANLFLVRGTQRRRELAVHMALGCSGRTVLRRLLMESGILAICGGVLGALLASWGLGILPLLLREVGPAHLSGVAIDGRILAFLLVVTGATGLAFGAAPALRAARIDPATDLAGARQSPDRSTRRLHDALAVVQIAIALVLLTSASLLLVTFERLRAVDLGFAVDDVLTFSVALPDSRYDAEARARFHDEFPRRLSELTGASVGAVSHLPTLGSSFSWGAGPLTGPLGGDDRGWTQADQRVVTGDYFAAMSIPVVGGRTFSDGDGNAAPRRFVINRAAAERFFPGIDPVGQGVRVAFLRGEVVGVVENVAVDVEGGHVPEVYHAHRQFADNRNWILDYVVSGTGDQRQTLARLPALRTALTAMDPQLVLFQPRPLEAVVGRGLAERKVALFFLVGFAVTATTLAVLGVYAVLAHGMLHRRREIAVRLALGATGGGVRLLVLRRALALAALAIGIGLPIALAFGRSLEFLMFHVTAADPLVLAGVTAVMLGATLGAAWPTVRGVGRIEPAAVLREE